MDDTYIQRLMIGLKESSASLPLHQKKLRAQLIETYACHHPPYVSRFMKLCKAKLRALRKAITGPSFLEGGVMVALFCTLLVSSVTVRPAMTGNVPEQLVATATALLKRMPPKEAAMLGHNYEPMSECLAEAARSTNLRIATFQQSASLLPPGFTEAQPLAKTYLLYTNEHHRQVVIVLGMQGEPLYAAAEHIGTANNNLAKRITRGY